jgi:hypothetical protein
MTKILAVILFLTSSIISASELKVIQFTDQIKENDESFFLYGTTAGNYVVRSSQVDMEKLWDGKGEPNISLGTAIEKAYQYFDKSTDELGVKQVTFRPAFSKKGTVIWFYHVTLTVLPYSFNAKEFEVSVLTSGEVLPPHKPKG